LPCNIERFKGQKISKILNKEPKYYYRLSYIILFLVLLLIAIWQIFFILNIPDIDTDAYVHHVISRQIIISPGDLSIHWVWLPLFHYLSAVAILIGAGMDTVRFINVAIWFITPFILFRYLYKVETENKLFIAFLSSVLCALFPVGILMGTTAQPEPIFSLLILLFVISASRKRYLLSSIILGLACMLRYEAWAVLFAVFILYIYENYKAKKLLFDSRVLNIIIPVIFILVWAFLREPFDGKLFGFLTQTQEFANDALKEKNSFQGGFFKIIKDFFHYPIFIPLIFTGLNVLFLPFGIKSFYRNNKLFLFSGIGILAFITASWMMKSNLGLNRHFVSMIPFYSVLTAYGILNVSKYLQKYFENKSKFKSVNIKKSLQVIIFITCISYLVMWLYIWQTNNKEGFQERKAAAEFFKTIDNGKTIFCNDAIFEIESKIDMRRFNHVWMENNPAALESIKQLAKKEGNVYVISSTNKIQNLDGLGKIIFTSPRNEKTNADVIILRVEGK
jgi:hypothetical protein